MLKPPECDNCILAKRGNGFIPPFGTGRNGVVIIGEGGGYEEYIHAEPFYKKAQAGSKLEEIFRLEGVKREDFRIGNLVQCQPPGNKLEGANYEKMAIEHCEVHFRKLFSSNISSRLSSTVILALGNLPLKHLTGFSGDADRKESISFLRGFIYRSKWGLVIPSYHPSYLKRGKPELTPVLQFDLRRALEVANGEWANYPFHPSYEKPKYIVNPSLDEAKSFYYLVKDNQNRLLTYDIETPYSAERDEEEREDLEEGEITQIQFSLGRGTGMVFDLTSAQQSNYWKVATALLRLGNPKCNHNTWNFDIPRLKAKGVVLGGNENHDSMWMFKHYHPRLPRGLQAVASMAGFPFPWKHTFGDNLPFYGGCDVDAVHYIFEWLPPLMKDLGVWEGYERHVRQMYRVLSRASDVGMPVVEEKRVELKVELTKQRVELNSKLQKLIPDEVRNIGPVRSRDKEGAAVDYGFKKEPKEIKDAQYLYYAAVEKVKAAGKAANKVIVSLDDFIRKKYNLVRREITGIDGDTREVISIERWCRILPFKASKDQVVNYLRWKRSKLLEEPNVKVRIEEEDERIS